MFKGHLYIFPCGLSVHAFCSISHCSENRVLVLFLKTKYYLTYQGDQSFICDTFCNCFYQFVISLLIFLFHSVHEEKLFVCIQLNLSYLDLEISLENLSLHLGYKGIHPYFLLTLKQFKFGSLIHLEFIIYQNTPYIYIKSICMCIHIYITNEYQLSHYNLLKIIFTPII